jgi:hypothetical protein
MGYSLPPEKPYSPPKGPIKVGKGDRNRSLTSKYSKEYESINWGKKEKKK